MELLRRDCSRQAITPLACAPVWLAGRIQRGIQPASDPRRVIWERWATADSWLIPRDQLQARNHSPHGCSASTHVVCGMNVTAITDTVKWHNLCTRACVCYCLYVFMYVCVCMNVCMYVLIYLSVVYSTTLPVSQIAARWNNSEFVCTRKEFVAPDFRYNPGICQEAMRKLWGKNYFVRFGVFFKHWARRQIFWAQWSNIPWI